MKFQVLGPLQVEIGGGARAVSAAKPRKLLGVLLVHANQVVSADRLLEEVWGDVQPKGGVKTLRYHISKLRDVLEPGRGQGEEGVVGTEAGGYALRVEPDQVDAGRFQRLADEGGQLLADGRFEVALERLAGALGLWRGGAFEDFRYDSFAQGEIARLEESRLLCVENRVGADLELGRHRDVVGELRELTTRYPMREGLWGQLMVALYRTDQQAEALAAYQKARTVLGEELGIEPNTALQRLEEQILLHELPFEASTLETRPRDNLPARVASFVGRADEVTAVEKLIGSHRLVTLTGFGGIGKTTLALEVARHLNDNYPDGVWLVELAALTDPSYLVGEIAQVFEVTEHPTRPLLEILIEELSKASTLLVIGNCEHLIDEAARVVSALLDGCPALRILATSRQQLGVVGEQTWPVPPLHLPAVEAEITVVFARGFDAVRLFVDRANEAQPAFDLNEANVEPVVTICRRLDGIPLALELAAARLTMLSPGQLLARLEDRFAVLTDGGRTRPERQQTLRAAMEWSYHLLNTQEQILLRRLAVFEGGFNLEAAEAVCSGDGIDPADILDLIGHLLDASLLTVGAGETTRYDMLESIHDFTRGLLAESGEDPSLRGHHADYHGSMFSGDSELDSVAMGEMYEKLVTEKDNFQSALAWAVEAEEGGRALRLAASVWPEWFFNSRMEETLYWYPRVLELAESTPNKDRAIVLLALGHLFSVSGRTQESLPLIEELGRIADALDDPSVMADSLWIKALYAWATGDFQGSRRIHMNAVKMKPDLPDFDLSMHLSELALLSVEVGEFEYAAEIIDELAQLGAVSNLPLVSASAVGLRGTLARYQGDLHRAQQLQLESLGELRRLDLAAVQSEPLRELAHVSLAAGEIEKAEFWAGQAMDLGRRNAVTFEIVDGQTVIARAALRRGDLPIARNAAAEALELSAEGDDIPGLALVLVAAAQVGWAADDPMNSTVLHAGAEALRVQMGFVHPAHRKLELDRELDEVRRALGTNAFSDAWQSGTLLDSDKLVDLARGVLSA